MYGLGTGWTEFLLFAHIELFGWIGGDTLYSFERFVLWLGGSVLAFQRRWIGGDVIGDLLTCAFAKGCGMLCRHVLLWIALDRSVFENWVAARVGHGGMDEKLELLWN